jgi:cytochrome c
MNKTLVASLSVALLFAACGNSGDNTPPPSKDTTASAPAAASSGTTGATSAGDKALELIGASDCTTCHRLQESASGPSIGPAYSKVADKYSPAADSTVDRLVKKIASGGSGVWGTIPMTPHPSVPEADIRTMVKYILSLKK